METISRVRREFHVKGKKIKAIARELRVSRNTVRRIVRGDETVHRYARQEQPLPQLGAYVATLDQLDDPVSKKTMLDIADAYEQLAALSEAKRAPKSSQ